MRFEKHKKLFLLFSLLLLMGLFSYPFTAYGTQPLASPKIIGGFEAERDAWPWMAALIDADKDPYEGPFCGGSLIDSRWVVTAAHCVRESNGTFSDPGSIDVLLGIHDLKNDQDYRRFTLKQVIPHPFFDYSANENDIALLELTSAASGYETVLPVTDHNTFVGVMGTALGWGDTSTIGIVYPETLQQVSLPIISNQQCIQAYSDDEITDNMLCAGYSEGGKDTCRGDSGGPLVVQDGGVWKLAGISSWGQGCALPGFYGVYTRVSQYVDFISEYVVASYSPGDVNDDGIFDETDVLLVVDIIFGNKMPNTREFYSANVDSTNEIVDITDLLNILDMVF